MTLLDQKKMEILESNFLDYPRGIPFDRFIKLMRRVINIDKEKLIEFYLGLRKLFEDIDINNDKFLEWSEFTQYMIDVVVAAPKNALKERLEETMANDQENAEKLVQNAYFTSDFYFFQQHIPKELVFPEVITKLIYCHQHQILLLLYQHAPFVRLFDKDYNKMMDYYVLINGDRASSAVMDFDYEETQRIIGMITENKMMHFCHIDFMHLNLDTTIRTLKLDELQTKFWMLRGAGFWASTGNDNSLRIWKLVEGDVLEVMTVTTHDDTVTHVTYASKIDSFITSSMDGHLRLFNSSFSMKHAEPIKKHPGRGSNVAAAYHGSSIGSMTKATATKKKDKMVDGVRGRAILLTRLCNIQLF
jgi:hypothetical protein